jgi:hypothetical protein
MKISKNSKVLAMVHNDMDGHTCAIVLANVFNNIRVISATFTNIDTIIKNQNFEDYDVVFMCDVYPKDENIIKQIPNLIMLDHHATNSFHDPKKFRIVAEEMSATMLTHLYIQNLMKVDLSHLNNLVYIVNDYDMWIHKNYKSKMLNELFFFYKADKFRERFMDGDTRLTEKEIAFIRKRKKEFIDAYEHLEVYDMSKINACFFIVETGGFINDLCEALLKKEKYDVVFCQNTYNGNISVRTNKEEIDLGALFTEAGIGGGHAASSGLRTVENTPEATKDVLKVAEYELLKAYPQIAKIKS